MTIPHITDETRIVIDGITVTTFSEFVAANSDGLGASDIEEIKRSLTETREYDGGGGASADFKIGLAWDWSYQGPELNEHLAQLLEDQWKAEASGHQVEITRLKGEIVRTEAMSRAFDAAIDRGEGEPTPEAKERYWKRVANAGSPTLPSSASETMILEVFEGSEKNGFGPGWHYHFRESGIGRPDHTFGPYETEAEARSAADLDEGEDHSFNLGMR